MVSKLNWRVPRELETATVLMLGHDGLMRAGELASGLVERDLEWSQRKDRLYLTLARSKTCQEGGGVRISLVDYGPESAVRFMRTWILMRRAYEYDGPLFPRIGKDGKWGSKSIATSHIRTMIKSTARAAGMDDDLLSGHSLRAGGATDLFVERVPYYLIKKIGRWKSDAAMLYYRSTEDEEDAMIRAFGRI
jgi:integrase